MKYLIYIYYGLILLTGGIRSYSEEIILHETCSNISISPFFKQYIFVSEYFLIVCAICIVIFPFYKYLHLIFGVVIFSVDFTVENFVYFQKYIILINLFPLFIFFALHYKNSVPKITNFRTIIIRIVAIGYVAAFFGKVTTDWLNYEEPIIYGYVQLFNSELSNTFKLPEYLWLFNNGFLKINNHFIYKMMDYGVLLFQLSAIILFFKEKYFKWFSLFCAIFHISILLLLGIYSFHTYLLVYALILLLPFKRDLIEKKSIFEKVIILTLLTAYIFGLTFNNFDKGFLYRNDFLYVYSGLIMMLTCIFLFLIVWHKKYHRFNKL